MLKKVKDGNVVHIILKVEVSRLVLGGKIHKCKVWSGRTWSLKARNSLSAHLPDFIKAVFCLFIKDEAKLTSKLFKFWIYTLTSVICVRLY